MMYLPLTLPPHPQSLYSLSTLGYCNGTAQLHLGSTTVTTWPPTPCDYWIIIPFDTPSPHSFSVLISYPPTPGYCTGTAQLLPIGQKRSRPCPLWHSLSTIYLYTPYLTPYPNILQWYRQLPLLIVSLFQIHSIFRINLLCLKLCFSVCALEPANY